MDSTLGDGLVEIEEHPRQDRPGRALDGVACAGAGDLGGVELLALEPLASALGRTATSMRQLVAVRGPGQAAAEQGVDPLLDRARRVAAIRPAQRLRGLLEDRVVRAASVPAAA